MSSHVYVSSIQKSVYVAPGATQVKIPGTSTPASVSKGHIYVPSTQSSITRLNK